jgi:hypothetical protein
MSFSKLPNDIQDYILYLSNYKKDIKTYFTENIITKIDPTFKKINNNCELCYIQYFKGNIKCECFIHSIIPKSDEINHKYFSLYNLPNRKTKNSLGILFSAINDINRFQLIISETSFCYAHKLYGINYEIEKKFLDN